MPVLVLLNGPPASGKSTLAAAWIASRPLALALDIDLVRGQLGRWRDEPTSSGLAASALALSMIDVHLRAGHDEVVPQFVARPDFVVQLEATAGACGARFVEVALLLERRAALDAFARRSASPADRQQRDAAEMVSRDGGEPALIGMYDRLEMFLATRPALRRVEVIPDDVPGTLARLESAIAPDFRTS